MSRAHSRVPAIGTSIGRVAIDNAAAGCEVRSCSDIARVVCTKIDADTDPHEETIGDVLTNVCIVREWIVRVVGLVGRPHVLVVGSDGLGVGRVGRGSFDYILDFGNN